MISGLHGTIARFGPSRIYINTGGVEYEVHLPLNVFESLQKRSKDDAVSLYTYHQFQETEQRLFGFLDIAQRDFFVALIDVKGIGTGLALSILSHLKGSDLLALCERNDIVTLCKIPRIGKSTAETLVFEVNRRKDKWKHLLSTTAPMESVSREEDFAIQALTAQLGYKENQVRAALEKLKKEAAQRKDLPLENAADYIRNILRHL